MYTVLLEFPEEWGGVRKSPFCGGGMDILELHNAKTPHHEGLENTAIRHFKM